MVKYKIQYFSDTHLEFYNENNNKMKRMFEIKRKDADILLLAGDIGYPSRPSYTHFLTMMSPHFEKVFVISGNHEYYKSNMEMTKVDQLCRHICSSLPQQNVHFLQNEEYQLSPLISVYGTTLWTNIHNDKATSICNIINDYKYIDNLTHKVSNDLHNNAVKKLTDCIINKEHNQKVIVMTHHMPSFNLIDTCYKAPMYTDINCAFATDIPIRNDPRIVAWVYGHTHKSRHDGKFYCNPIGYPGENKQWSVDRFFEIDEE
jgi:predicted phosphohydrolase